MMSMFGSQRTPFYSFTTQYHHGDIEKNHKEDFSLVGLYNSDGDLNAIFSKNLGNWTFKI